MENIVRKIEGLGLSDKEAVVYLALLRAREATVIKLAKTTGIKRTTIYHCIEDLIHMGLATKLIKDDRTFYLAEDPKISFENLITQRKNIVDSIVPELKDMFGKGALFPEIRAYYDISGLQKIFEDLLTCREKIARYYVSSFDVENLLGKEFVDKFVKRRIEAGIKSRSLRSFKYKPEREAEAVHAKQIREVKFMPEKAEDDIRPYICIYDDKVAVIIAEEEKFGFVIQSKSFADAQKAIFDMVWNSAAI